MTGRSIYDDIADRTNGEFMIGVTGPVRTGKSTFIKRFIESAVLPRMEDEYERTQLRDELPQSAGGRTVMTAEPKFIPDEAASVALPSGGTLKMKMIDCVFRPRSAQRRTARSAWCIPRGTRRRSRLKRRRRRERAA